MAVARRLLCVMVALLRSGQAYRLAAWARRRATTGNKTNVGAVVSSE